MNPRILVLSESFGLGHEKAALALIEGIRRAAPGTGIFHTDSISQGFPRLKGSIFKMYLQLIKTLPRTWHRFYEKSRSVTDNKASKNLVHRLLSGTLAKTLDRFRPDVVVCTHPFPAAAVSRLKQDGMKIPLAGIITDYDVHPYWLDPNIDLYITGDPALGREFAGYGFVPRQVSGEGIPIDPRFAEQADREKIRTALGYTNTHPLILVAGGGWGLGRLDRIAGMLAVMPERPEVAVITGINDTLKKTMLRRFAGFNNVTVHGLVDNMYEYMSAADVVVTKPGGLTTSEGLAAGVPMVLFDVLYGQEVWNAEFLTGHGAAVRCGRIDEIPRVVRSIIQDSRQSNLLIEKARSLGKPGSAANAAQRILKLAKWKVVPHH